MPGSQFRVEVLPATDLQQPSRHQYLLQINELINDAYRPTNQPVSNGQATQTKKESRFAANRLSTDDQLIHELGKNGVVAICADEDIPDISSNMDTPSNQTEQAAAGRYGNSVAVASMKPWAGRKTTFYEKVLAQVKLAGEDGRFVSDAEVDSYIDQYLAERKHEVKAWEWELATCATANDPAYRKQGLMTKCVDALIEHLHLLRKQMRENNDPRGSLPVVLWVTALVGAPTPAYWARRGFVDAGPPDRAPAGMWGSKTEFEVQSMKRVLFSD